jgi:uncharacterized DUF497 family protein
VKPTRWDPEKKELLKRTRGISFEDAVQADIIDVVAHPKQPHQRILLVEYQDYVWAVPYVENDQEIFLKTIYRSRQFTRLYRKGRWKK